MFEIAGEIFGEGESGSREEEYFDLGEFVTLEGSKTDDG